MELRRSRDLLGCMVFLAAIGLVVVVIPFTVAVTPKYVLGAVAGGIILVMAVALIRDKLKPFRFGVDTDGLALRTPQIARLVRWHEIDVLVLDQEKPALGGGRSRKLRAPRLILIPDAGTDLGGQQDAGGS